MQEWRSVHGFEEVYEVSNTGLVRRKGKEKPLFQTLGKEDARGHKPRAYVQLWKDGKSYLRSVHRIVALAFVPNPDNKPTVNHKDGNPLNNNASNLEWATYSENQKHAYENGLIKPKRPYKQKTCRPVIGTDKAGKTIRFSSVHEAARELGVTVMAVSNVVRENEKRTENKRSCKGYVMEYDKCLTTIESTAQAGSE